MIAPKIDEMSGEHPDIPILKVDIDEHESLASEAGIRVSRALAELHFATPCHRQYAHQLLAGCANFPILTRWQEG